MSEGHPRGAPQLMNPASLHTGASPTGLLTSRPAPSDPQHLLMPDQLLASHPLPPDHPFSSQPPPLGFTSRCQASKCCIPKPASLQYVLGPRRARGSRTNRLEGLLCTQPTPEETGQGAHPSSVCTAW